MAKYKSKVIWCDRGFFPSYYGFCPDEKSWRAEMRRLKQKEDYPVTDARVTTYTRDGLGDKPKLLQIVTINNNLDGKINTIELAGLIVHEAVHVFQHICEDMGERSPSNEFQSYATQFIFQQLMSAFKLSKRKVKK